VSQSCSDVRQYWKMMKLFRRRVVSSAPRDLRWTMIIERADPVHGYTAGLFEEGC
jgi:hypothetical protein